MCFELEEFWREPTPEEVRRRELELEYRRKQEQPATPAEQPKGQPEPAKQ